MTRPTRTRFVVLLVLVVFCGALGGAALGWAGATTYVGARTESAVLVVVPRDCDEKQKTDL